MTRIRKPRISIRHFPFDLMRTALLLCAFLSLAAGAALLVQRGSTGGEGHVFIISSLALVLAIIFIALLIAD